MTAKSKRYPDCAWECGDCAACSLSNYNRDCHNNPINTVAYYRQALGLSQQKLANLAGVHINQVQRLEYGKINPANMSLKNGLALAKALGIEPDKLL